MYSSFCRWWNWGVGEVGFTQSYMDAWMVSDRALTSRSQVCLPYCLSKISAGITTEGHIFLWTTVGWVYTATTLEHAKYWCQWGHESQCSLQSKATTYFSLECETRSPCSLVNPTVFPVLPFFWNRPSAEHQLVPIFRIEDSKERRRKSVSFKP